jgi:hypothetical protein
METSKKIKIAGVVVVLVLLVIGGFLWSKKNSSSGSNPTPTQSGTKTYTGVDFTIKYPSPWESHQVKEGVRTIVTFFDVARTLAPQVLVIASSPNQGGITLESWYQELQKSKWNKVGETKINGQVFYELNLAESDAPARFIGLVSTGSKMIDVSSRLNNDERKDIFSDITFSK